MRITPVLVALLALAPASVAVQVSIPYYPAPGAGWEHRAATTVGMNPALVDSAVMAGAQKAGVAATVRTAGLLRLDVVQIDVAPPGAAGDAAAAAVPQPDRAPHGRWQRPATSHERAFAPQIALT